MHEMSICEGIVQILQDQAQAQHYHKVKQVWLEIGKFSTVENSALEFCFDAVCKGTLAEGATLTIITLPAQAWCMDCAKTVELQQRFDACPECGGYQMQFDGGDELRIKELEVD